MSDRRLRETERDYHAGRISGTEWRDILLARDPDRLTIGLCTHPVIGRTISYVCSFSASEPIEQGTLLESDGSRVRPASGFGHVVGVAVSRADAGESVDVYVRGRFPF